MYDADEVVVGVEGTLAVALKLIEYDCDFVGYESETLVLADGLVERERDKVDVIVGDLVSVGIAVLVQVYVFVPVGTLV